MINSGHPYKIARIDDSQLESHDDSQQDEKDSQSESKGAPKLAFKKLRIMSETPEVGAQFEQKLQLIRTVFDQYLKTEKEQQATEEINAKLGIGSVSRFQIAFFFSNFRSHHLEIFKDQIKRHESIEDNDYSDQVFNRVLHTNLFTYKEHSIQTPMLTVDGRIAVFPPRKFSENAMIIDLFAGTKRSLKVECEMLAGVTNFVMLDQKYILSIYSHKEENYVFLFELDYKKWTLEKVDMHAIKEGGKIVKDLLDSRKTCWRQQNYLKELVKVNANNLSECKLEANKLSGIRKVQLFGQGTNSKDEFVEIDLEKQKQLAIELPRIEVNCEKNSIITPTSASAWLDSKLYALYHVDFSFYQLFVFDTKTNEWTHTQIKIPKLNPKALFVDQNGMITIHAYKEEHRPSMNTHFFYRFSLNQPDSLLNMTWLTIQNYSRLFKLNYLYQAKLPDFFEFAPRVPNET